MRVIFSRKGFDSAAGGVPSPIVDGIPVSLPIPAGTSPTQHCYGDLTGPYAALVTDLTRGRITATTPCHLDPDIRREVLPRDGQWRGALGQCHSSQSHLANRGITTGDLFLFFGWFRPAVETAQGWRYIGPEEHRLWGWLSIGDIIDLGADGSHAAIDRPWLRDHPHVREGWSDPNHLYIPADSGTFAQGLPLSVPGGLKSIWQVPDWLNPARGGVGMTYHHNPSRWSSDGTVRTVGRGQEFVADIGDRTDAREWIDALLENVVQRAQ